MNPINQFNEREAKKFTEKCNLNFAKGGFMTTDFDGTWLFDEKTIKEFLMQSNSRSMQFVVEQIKKGIGEDVEINFQLLTEEQIATINFERARIRQLIDGLQDLMEGK